MRPSELVSKLGSSGYSIAETDGAGSDTIRLTGAGFNRVWAGDGDDIVYGYSKDAARIDCGPGEDFVKIGYNRKIRTTNCERVEKRYKR